MSTDFQTEIKSKEEYLATADLTFTPSILKIRKVKKSPMDGIEKVTFKSKAPALNKRLKSF